MVELQNFGLILRVGYSIGQLDSFRRGRFVRSLGSTSVRLVFHPNHLPTVPNRFLLKSYDLLHSISGSYPRFSSFFYRRKIKKSYYTLKLTLRGFQFLFLFDVVAHFVYPFLASSLVGKDFFPLKTQTFFSFTEPGFVSKNLSLVFSSFAEFERYIFFYFSISPRPSSFSLLFSKAMLKSIQPRQFQIAE